MIPFITVHPIDIHWSPIHGIFPCDKAPAKDPADLVTTLEFEKPIDFRGRFSRTSKILHDNKNLYMVYTWFIYRWFIDGSFIDGL